MHLIPVSVTDDVLHRQLPTPSPLTVFAVASGALAAASVLTVAAFMALPSGATDCQAIMPFWVKPAGPALLCGALAWAAISLVCATAYVRSSDGPIGGRLARCLALGVVAAGVIAPPLAAAVFESGFAGWCF